MSQAWVTVASPTMSQAWVTVDSPTMSQAWVTVDSPTMSQAWVTVDSPTMSLGCPVTTFHGIYLEDSNLTIYISCYCDVYLHISHRTLVLF